VAEPDGFDAVVVARSPALLRSGWLLAAMNELDELRRRLVDATPDFPAVSRAGSGTGPGRPAPARADPRRPTPTHADQDWPGYTGELRFRLRDGTTVVRQWDLARRLIVGDIRLPASVVAVELSSLRLNAGRSGRCPALRRRSPRRCPPAACATR